MTTNTNTHPARVTDETDLFVVFAKSEEFGDVMLSDYVGTMRAIRNRVTEGARREGFAGDFVERMAFLEWRLEPLYLARHTPSREALREVALAAWMEWPDDDYLRGLGVCADITVRVYALLTGDQQKGEGN